VPSQLAEAIGHVSRYTERALIQTSADRARLRRQTYRELSDLNAEFQRALSEPPALSRQATIWWPALVGLEQVMDTVTATAVAVEHGAPPPSPDAVRKVSITLDRFATSVRTGAPPPPATDLPTDQALAPVTDAVRTVRAVLV
jgi:hypothetical protein